MAGTSFWPGLLARLVDVDAARLPGILERLEARALIVPQAESSIEGEREYAFKHALTQQVAYESLPRRERMRAHAPGPPRGSRRRSARGAAPSPRPWHTTTRRPTARRPTIPGVEAARREDLRARALSALLQASGDFLSTLALDGAERSASAPSSWRAAISSDPRRWRRSARRPSPAFAATVPGRHCWPPPTRAAAAPDDHAAISRLCARALELPTRWGSLQVIPSIAEARHYLDLGLEHAGPGDSEARARLLTSSAVMPLAFFDPAAPDSEFEAARARGEEAVEIARRLDRPDLESAALDGLGSHAYSRGEYEAARGAQSQAAGARAAPRGHPRDRGRPCHGRVGSLQPGPLRRCALARGRGLPARSGGVTRGRGALPGMAQPRELRARPVGRVPGRRRARHYGAARARGRGAAGLSPQAVDGRGPRAPPARRLPRHRGCARPDASGRDPGRRSGRGGAGSRAPVAGAAPGAPGPLRRGARRDRDPRRALVPPGSRPPARVALRRRGHGRALGRGAGAAGEAGAGGARGGLLALRAHALRLEGRAARARSDLDSAIDALSRARVEFHRLGARWERACTELDLAESLAAVKRPDQARACFTGAWPVFEELHSVDELARATELRARLSAGSGSGRA